MSIAIMQPYFLPYLGYFQLINSVDTFVIYDDVNFIKKGYINRNSILISGKPHKITLEILEVSQNKLINQLSIGCNNEKLLKTIEINYKKAPFFNEVFPIVYRILKNNEKNLSKFIAYSLIIISDYLSISTKFIFSSNIKKNNSLKAQDKILNICNKLGTIKYINSIGGKELYSNEEFKKHNIELKFLESELIMYKQFNNEFIPNLSIIDVLMFNDKNNIKKMLESYKLI